MVKHFTIRKKLNITLVFRHRFEKKQTKFNYTFTRWEIGLWFKKTAIVGTKDFQQPTEWSKNLVNSYWIGLEFLWFRTWIEWDFDGMHIDTNE